ncbi:MAG: RluA family pseudouridine synthase, partial [Clostridium sp.]
MRIVTVTKNEAGQRLDKLLLKYLNLAGKSFIYKMLRKKNITLNAMKCDGSEKLN